MRSATLSFITIFIACALWASGFPSAAQEPPGASAVEPSIRMLFRNKPLDGVVKFVASKTGKSFIYGDKVRGRVTITGDALVTPEEALSILEVTLSLQGLATLPTPGGPLKIINLGKALVIAPWEEPEALGQSEAPITTMVHLRHARTDLVIATLQKLIGKKSLAMEYPKTNALILAGRESQVRRLLTMVRALDREDFEDLTITNLRFADAKSTANQLDYAINDPSKKRPSLHIWSDERTNSVLMLASPPVLAQARTLVEEIDRPAEGGGDILVVPIRHVDPATLAEKLNALAQPSAQRSGAVGNALASSALQARRFNLVVDAPTRSLLIMGDPETRALLLEVIDQLDRVVQRIMVEAIVTEMFTPSAYRLGFSAFVPLGSQDGDNLTAGAIVIDPTGSGLQPTVDATTPFIGSVTNGTLEVPVLQNGAPQLDENGDPVTVSIARETAVVVAGETQVTSKILMRPSLLMTSGEQREVFVGSNIPIPVQNTGTDANNPLVISQSVERQDVGITLRATPTLGIEGGVNLALEVEIRSVTDSVAGDVAVVGPTLRQRNITTNMNLRDGEIMVAGGFTGVTTSESVQGVPWLKDLPFLGWLFRDTTKVANDTTIVIAAQARILRTDSDLLAETIRRRLGFERALERVEELETEAPYAVLVTTRTNEDDAQEIAEQLSTAGRTAAVSGWEGMDQPYYDVYLIGYERIEDAGDAAIQVRVDGWTPEVVALPPR